MNWILEIAIVILAGWAVWLTLPKTPNIPWPKFQGQVLQAWLTQSQELMKTQSTQEIVSTISDECTEFSRPAILLSWSDVYLNSPILEQHLHKHLSHCVVVGAMELLQPLMQMAQIAHLQVDDFSKLDITVLEGVLSHRHQRLIFVAQKEDAQHLLAFLHQYPGVRDFTAIVVLLEPLLSQTWLAENFAHDQMDVEANIAIPYFFVTSDDSIPLNPIASKTGWQSIEVIPLHRLSKDMAFCLETWWALVAMIWIKRKEEI